MIEHPLLQELDAKRQEIDAREAVLRASAEVVKEQHAQMLADWKSEHDLAIDLGAGPPARPDPPDTNEIDRELRHLGYERVRLREQERAVWAEILPEVVVVAYAAQDDARERARPHLDALAEIFRTLVEAHRDLLTVRGAADLADPNHRPAPGFGQRARSLQTITFAAFIESVLHDIDLLAIRPLPSRSATAPHVDRAPVEPRRLGLTKREGWGAPPKAQSPKPRSPRHWT